MKRSETTEQIELFRWAKQWEEYVPELALLHHIPNEGERTNGALLKAMGLKRGVPDIFLPVAGKVWHGLYIEMKYGKNRSSKEQRLFMERLEAAGYKTVVAYSAEAAKEEIRKYLSCPSGFSLGECESVIGLDGTCRGLTAGSRCKGCKYRRQ